MAAAARRPARSTSRCPDRCRYPPLGSADARVPRCALPASLRRMRRRSVAVLRTLRRRAHVLGATVLRALRPPHARAGRFLPRLSARADRVRPRAVPVRGPGEGGDPPPEVLGMARGRRRARRRDGHRGPVRGRRRDVGSARARAARRTRVRPGEGARGRGLAWTRRPGQAAPAAGHRDGPPGPPVGGGPPGSRWPARSRRSGA